MQLIEKYRPKSLDEVLGQGKVIESLRRLIGRKGFDRDAIWIEGPTGTGKTSIAWALAQELGADSWSIQEIDGDSCTVDCVRAISGNIGLSTLSGSGWKAYIVNEAHAMSARAVQAWLTLLERLPARRLIVFTTTEESQNLFGSFSQPFLDRTKDYRLTKIGLREIFARRVYEIAKKEKLNGRPFSAYLQLLSECHNSMRAALQRIERGDMLKPVDHSPAIKKMLRGRRRAAQKKASADVRKKQPQVNAKQRITRKSTRT